MTRYVIAQNILAGSSDPDGDPIFPSHLSVNAGSTPALIDWVATPVVIFSSWTNRITGQIEVRKDGSVIYDDLGNGSMHPPTGTAIPAIVIRFKTTDSKGAVSAAIGTYTLTLTSQPADVTAPTIVSVSPSAGAALVQAFEFVCSEPIQMGSGNIVIRDVAAGTTVETITLPGAFANPVAPGKVFVQGSSFFVQPTAALTAGKQYSFRPAAGFVKDLAGNNLAVITDDSISIRTAGAVGGAFADDPRGWRGQSNKNYGTVLGTDFDYLVDPAGGGTHTTIAAANTAAVAGKVVAIKAGTYYEAVTLKSGVTYQSYGADRPIVSAQTADLTGFVQCSASDAGVLGSVLGVASSPVYKKTGLLKSTFPISNLRGLNVTEANMPIFAAQDRTDRSMLSDREDEETFYDPIANGGRYYMNGVAVTAANAPFNQIKDPTIINSSRYTDAKLLKADMWVFASPNETIKMSVIASDVANNLITLNSTQKTNADSRARYAVGNIGFAMVAGSWFYVDNGTTFDLYVYPRNVANISKIAYAARKSAFTLPSGSPSNITVQGINFVGGTGTAYGEGSLIADVDNTNFSNNTKIENCRFTAIENIGQLQFAAVHLARSNNHTIQNNTFEYCVAHGVWPTGKSADQTGSLSRRNAYKYCGSAGIKAYSQNQFAQFHDYHFHCGYRSHGNLSNVYISGSDAMWWGNEWDECQGYLTCQDMYNPHAFFNLAPTFNKRSPRKFGKFEDQGGRGTSYCCNNSAPPVEVGPLDIGGCALDWGYAGKTCYEYNNVAHGIPIPADQGGTVTAKNNLVTNSGYSGSIGGNLNASKFTGVAGQFDTTNVWNTNLTAIFRDYPNKDYRPASAASPLLTTAAFDITSIVNALKPTFPMVPAGDWNLDVFGNTINWGALKIGADQSISFP